MEDVERVGYFEVQQFRQLWLWGLMIPIAFYFVYHMVPGMYQQLVLDQPWGRKSMSNGMLILAGILSGLASVGVPIMLYVIKMITTVNDTDIDVHFYPFKRAKIPFEKIVTCEARTYRAITEYGGWGIRNGLQGRAYNISGNQGVQLVLDDGKKVLIGSQRSDELANLINQRRDLG